MGVRDLLQWGKKVHPQTIKTFRQRWQDPQIRGKRVAIDATLLTNAFHFGWKKVLGEELSPKAGLIGWHQLISEMRASDVSPIAIWDQRGTREWKAAEARRRLARRALLLARRTHEDERGDRLTQFREVMDEYEGMSDVEKHLVRTHWASSGAFQVVLDDTKGSTEIEAVEGRELEELITPPPGPATGPSISTPPLITKESIVSTVKAETVAEVPLETAEAIIDRVSSFIGDLSTLVTRYNQHSKPFKAGRRIPSGEVSEAIEHVRELEELSGGGEIASYGNPAKKEDVELIDETLEEVVPTDEYSETRTQTQLTREEGEILRAFLSGSPISDAPEVSPLVRSEEVEAAEVVETIDSVEVDLRAPTERLDELIVRSPEVKAIYVRALDMPAASDHEDCRELLVRMGVPVLTANVPYEAEGLATSLWKEGLVDFVGTEDSDVLAYQGPLLRGVSASSKALKLIEGEDLRTATGLDPTAFLDFCILLGTDASGRIPGVGPVSAFKMIQKHISIEGVLEAEPKVKDKVIDLDDFMASVHRARKVFGELPPIPEGVDLTQGVWNQAEVEEWLLQKHGIGFQNEGERRDDRGRFEDLQDHSAEMEEEAFGQARP